MSSAVLSDAHDCVFNNAFNQTTVNIAPGSGIEKLLKASMPEAFHDSGARDPPRCHPGTRLDYIDRIFSWGLGALQCGPERILWMQGPAGVGKSAIAQSCAELLAKQKLLGAAFFFSRPNQRDNPACLFTSISYQISTKSSLFSDTIDRDIRNDPTLVAKSIAQQFYGLLTKPLEDMREAKEDMKDYVIIVDGLDECTGIKSQREILEVVTKSVRDATTPFRWAFFSRPESHIIASFTSDHLRHLSLHFELPVSRDIDYEILCYLTSELEKIREERNLPLSWLSERDLGVLVDRSAGLFIYASTIIRFVGERNSQGPINQLRLVLRPTKQASKGSGSNHPLSELDTFYTLIMQCIPSKILPTVLNVLLLHNTTPEFPGHQSYNKVEALTICLNLSEDQVQNACTALRSVLEFNSETIKFYHASFMDFLQDPDRSKEFYLYGDCLDAVRQTLLERLNEIHARYTEAMGLDDIWGPGSCSGQKSIILYRYLANSFFLLCSHPRPLCLLTAADLVTFQFDTLRCMHFWYPYGGREMIPEILRQNLPIELQDKVIYRSHNPILNFWRPPRVKEGSACYVVGQGKNRILWWGDNNDGPTFGLYPFFLKFWTR